MIIFLWPAMAIFAILFVMAILLTFAFILTVACFVSVFVPGAPGIIVKWRFEIVLVEIFYLEIVYFIFNW